MHLSREGIRAIAESGYVFLFPLVTTYHRMYAEAIDPSSPTFAGGFGRWMHRRHAVSLESEVATSYAADLTSSAWLDLRSEPCVLSIAPVGVEQTSLVTDLWGLVVDASTDPEPEGRSIVIAGKDWVGAVPADADHVVRAETCFVRPETWVRIDRPGDLEPVREIQRTSRIEPLSSWSADPAAPPAPAIAWWPVDADTVTSSTAFWSAAAFALSLTSPNDEDGGILERLAEIGVVPGARWDPHGFPADVIEGIGEGMDEALTALMRSAVDARPPPHRTRTAVDRDYFGRAVATLCATPVAVRSR